ncbi:MAG TPA: hypothetical protein VL550_04835 [Rhodocyclaceae bacterium]|nr:hypothetical protein [Rhodocyclaceae bacterium]
MNDLQQNLQTSLQMLGIAMPTPAFLVISTLFGLIGVYAWLRGRRAKLLVFKWIGFVLMLYPLFVSDTIAMTGIGLVLCAALYVYRDR